MEDLTQCEDAFNEYNDNREETFNEIRKNLLDDFETAKTVSKALKDGSKLSSISGEREPVKVYLRVRPFTNKEVTAGESQQCLEIVNSSCVFMHPPKTSFTFKHQSRNPITAETIHRFSFSHVFGPDTSQKTFFEDTSLGVVKDFIDGQNCLIFSYGVTNAGKTYTILGNGQNLGILPRTINILFNSFKDQNYKHANLKPKMFCDVVKLSSIQEEREDSKKKMLLSLVDVPTYHNSISSTDLSLQDISQEQCSNEVLDAINLSSLLDVTSVDVDIQGPIQFSLWISFAEIYNEHIYDLLEPISVSKEKRRTVLKVGDDRKGNPYIKGLTEIHVNNADEAMKLLKIGRKNQKIASTKLNENSSRSHCIFTLKILRVVNTKEPHVARVSRLSFVDLAGSERYTKTKNTGVRLKEAGNINTSIMTLGKCVELLRYNQNHASNPRNIPFRESKLTRLFQGFFCGKGKAQMIVNVNQCASAFDETLHALKFSAIAKKVTTMVQAPQPPPADANDPVPRCARTSVIWADGSLSTPAGNKARTEINGDDDDMAPLAEEEKTDVSEHTSQELEALVKILQGQLIQEKKNMALLEVKIREEVCQEMAEQMVEIENNYNERLMEDQRMHEDLYEKRMDLLAKSVKKSRKRPRVDRIEDDDDEWVSSVCLHKEQVKVQEFKEEINTLQQQLKETEESKSKEVEWFKKELSNRNEKIKSLEQTVEECKAEVENGLKELEKARNHEKNCTETLEIKIDDYKVEMERQLAGRNEKITSLERTVKEYKSELESKTSQLLAAKKVHGGRTTTPTKTTGSNNIMKQLEKRLEETTAALDKKNSQLIDKNNVIAKLENSLKDAKDDLNEREKELDEVRGKLQLSSDEKENIETYENKINEMNEKLKEKEDIVGIKTKEVEEAVESLKFVEGELEILACKDKENQKEITKLRQDQKELKESYEQEKVHLEDKLAEKEGAVKEMENTLKEAQSATGDSQAKIEEFRNTVEEKESELLRFEVKLKHSEEIINGLRKQIIEMQEDNKELQEKFTRALTDLANTQAIVNARNQELEHFESLDKSLKDAYRDKETEIMQLKRELENTRNQLQNKENDFNHIKDEIEKRKHEEILKVNENWGSATERLKIGLLEQDETLAQMEKELLEKENELNDLRQQAEKLLKDNDEKKRKLENLSQENESLDDQTERLKIRVFELETEVEKLQQEVKKETSKKDTATASLRDGLEIIKTKKAEYESKIETISKEKEDMKTSYESRISELEGEIVRLKSGSCESSDDKTTSDKEAEPIRSSDGDDTYKAVEVESFNLPQKDRVEIDVTPITGSGLVKGGKKTASTKTKTMKRKSSDLTLKEIQDQLSAKSKRTNDFSEDDFTPVSVTKLRKTRSSSIANRSRQSRTNLFPSPSTCSLTTWKENSENTDPLQAKPSRSSQKSSSSGRRKFFHKLGLPENGKSKNEKSSIASQNTSKEMLSSVAPVKKRRRKLLKKTEISAPFTESPLPLSDKLDTPTPASRAQELITRHLRSRVVKTAR